MVFALSFVCEKTVSLPDMEDAMKKYNLYVLAVLFTSMLLTSNVVAAPQYSCSVNSVTLDSIELASGPSGNLLNSGPYDATNCLGLFLGNDNWVQSPSPNIGELNDGLLNGENPDPLFKLWNGTEFIDYSFTGEEFVDPSKFQDLDGDGQFTDPGWIELARGEVGEGSSSVDLTYNVSDFGNGNSINIGDILDIKFEFNDGTKVGTWTLETKPDIVDIVQGIAGRAVTFDHLVFSFKSGNILAGENNKKGKKGKPDHAGGSFSLYDFDFEQIFLNEGAGSGLNFLTPYVLSGTFNMDDFDMSMSHFGVWVRDPVDNTTTTVIPEPSTLILLGAGLAGLGYYSRRRKKD